MRGRNFLVGSAGLVGLVGAIAACDDHRTGAVHSEPVPDAGSDGSVLPEATCSPAAASSIEVSRDGLNAYPPYAIADCRLVYVSTSGELRLRDLATSNEEVLAPASDTPRAPTIGASVVAWEATVLGKRVVRVRSGSTTWTTPDSIARAGEAKASGADVVFTAWTSADEKSDSDVWLYEASTASATSILAGPGQQRFADVSAAFVAASDFSEDPDGRFDDNETDLADLVLYDRATHAVTKRKAAGKQAFPMLAAEGHVGYMDWSAVHPEPKFEAFGIRTGAITADPTSDVDIASVRYTGPRILPAGRAGFIEWVEDGVQGAVLRRAAAIGGEAPTTVSGLTGLDLYAPAPGRKLTILATSERTAPARITLRAIAR